MKKRLLAALFGLLLVGRLGASLGYRMDVSGKSPLFVKVSDPEDAAEALPLREPLLYLGGSLTWKPVAKCVEVELGESKATLVMEEGWAYMGPKRLALASPLHWKDGRLWLGRESLQALLREMNPQAPAFVSVSAEVLAALEGPLPRAEPTLLAPAEPVIVTGKEPPMAAALHGPIKRIVIDAGHGGYDPGARGARDIWEKDICLDIAKRLGSLIGEKMPGVEVVMTRDKDSFVSLKERTVKANAAAADLFVSIHNNASPSSKSRGSQVFFYDSRSSDRAAEELAKRENEDANYLEFIMIDLEKTLVRDQSILLGQSVQEELSQLGKGLGVRNRRLSFAPFYVLARTKMPAILVEVAFITNPKEARLLSSNAFKEHVAESIVNGLKNYRTEMARQ